MRPMRLFLFILFVGCSAFLVTLIPDQRINARPDWSEYKLWATY